MLPAALTAVLSVIYLFQISWFAGELMIPSVVILFIQLCNIAVAGILQIRLRERENEAQTKVTGISYQLIRGICKIKIAGAQEPAFQVWASVWKHMPVMGNAWILLSPVIAKVTALGGSIQNIVTDNEQTAKHMIEFLKKRGYTVLNLIEIRKPYKDEKLTQTIVVGEHEFDY